jgi:hypothetical protein
MSASAIVHVRPFGLSVLVPAMPLCPFTHQCCLQAFNAIQDLVDVRALRHVPNDAVLIREQERASGAYLCDLV